MPQRKHVKKVRMAPRTDANQGVREHIERVRKQNEYIIKKLAELRAKQEMENQRRLADTSSTTTSTLDGMGGVDDPVNA
jgi:hypothetical protein